MKLLFWPIGSTAAAAAAPVVGRLTVRELIIEALLEIGVLDPVDVLEEEDAATGLRSLLLMVDTFQADRLLLFTEQRVSFPLTANQATNTIGSGASFNTDATLGANAPRPDVLGLCTVTPVGDTIDYPLTPYDRRDDYLAEPIKSLTDLWPQRFLYEPTWPLGTFTWWPVPTTAAVVHLAWPVPLTVPATLATVLNFPPGYVEAWKLNLAKRLCHPYRKKVSDDLREDARLALGRLRRINDDGPPAVRSDAALVGGAGAAYDIRSNQRRSG